MLRRLVLLTAIAGCAYPRAPSGPTAPRVAADELFATDVAFSEASAKTDAVTGLAAMFDYLIAMPIQGNRFAQGKDQAVEALRANVINARSRVTWTPVRVGVSADGQHGFTAGYMTLQMPDSAPVPLKYLAYWVRKPEGWRVRVYRRRRYAEPPPEVEVMQAALPPSLVRPTTNGDIIAMYRASLDREERAFSDSAQVIGLGPAFAMFGSADAINLGDFNVSTFIVGAEAIGRAIGAGAPPPGSPVRWAPDTVLVASSGDLGVTIGYLRPNASPDAAPIPFFTIWRRVSLGDRWLYIAE
jgi:ketosteroid isomerase-like protein